MIIFWPALWANPIKPFLDMINEGILATGLGDETTSRLIYFADISNTSIITKIIHYPLQFIFRTNGFLVIGAFLSIFYVVRSWLKNRNLFFNSIIDFENFLILSSLLFILFYLGVISYPNKMIFRYILPIYPFIILFVSLILKRNWRILSTSYLKYLVYIFLIGHFIESLSSYPNSFTYYNLFAGGIYASARVVNTDQAGAGLPKIAYELNALKNSKEISVAVYDSIPFSQYFYGHSRMLKQYNPISNSVDTDYVILGIQGDDKYFDKGDLRYELVKEYSYRGQKHWYLYKLVENTT